MQMRPTTVDSHLSWRPIQVFSLGDLILPMKCYIFGMFLLLNFKMEPERDRGERVARRGGGVRAHGGGGADARQQQRRPRAVVSDDIRATIIDHIVNHGLSLRDPGLRVQPNLSRSTVASIVRIFLRGIAATHTTHWAI